MKYCIKCSNKQVPLQIMLQLEVASMSVLLLLLLLHKWYHLLFKRYNHNQCIKNKLEYQNRPEMQV